MDISDKEKGEIFIKVLRRKYLEFSGIKEEDIEKADKEQLLYENIILKQESTSLKSRNEELEKSYKDWTKINWIEFPELVINEKKRVFTFTSGEITKTCTFDRDNTNEYLLLMHFVNHLFISYSDKFLRENVLKNPRAHANESPKRRVGDIIKSLRTKLGKDIILDFPGSLYALFAETKFQE